VPLAIIVKPFKTPTVETMGMKWVRLDVLNEMRKVGRDMKKDFDKAFATFSEPKPKVETKIHLTRATPTATIDLFVRDPKGRVELLDAGTKSHMVAARRAKVMRWRGGFRSKTRPRWIGSRTGGQTGNPRFSRRHRVSGIKAREYGKTMVKRWQKPYSKRLDKAARRGARKAG
jgi:hypothetical protein